MKIKYNRKKRYNLMMQLNNSYGAIKSMQLNNSYGAIKSPYGKDFHIDYAPSSKAKCASCKKRIVKGSPRVWDYHGNIRNGNALINVKRRFCYKCGLGLLIASKTHFRQTVIDYNKTIKKFKRMATGKKSKRSLETMQIINQLEETV